MLAHLTGACASDESYLKTMCLDETDLVLTLSSNHRVMGDLGVTNAQYNRILIVRTQAWDRAIVDAKKSVLKETGRNDANSLFEAMARAQRDCAKTVIGQLTEHQQRRFWQIVRQTRGLDFIYAHQGVMDELGLTVLQRQRLTRICTAYANKMEPLARQIGRERIAGLGRGETIASRIVRIGDSAGRFEGLRAARDKEIRAVLSQQQREQVTQMLGKPFVFEKTGRPILLLTSGSGREGPSALNGAPGLGPG